MQNRRIGLFGSIATLVGFVIGASVFILPAELAVHAGPGVVFSFAIAGVMALFSCVVGAQIGAVFPVCGASFIASARLTGTYFGFIYIWLVLVGVAIGIALVALGFGRYFGEIFPGSDARSIAALSIVIFTLINLKGMNLTIKTQAAMVIAFMSVLILFSFLSWPLIEFANFFPLAPNGVSEIFKAAIPAYFSFMGFLVIIEIGGEIKNPNKTIPRALIISFFLVLITYLLISTSIVGVLHWELLAQMNTPFFYIGQKIHSLHFANILVLTILIAAASSINGLLFSFARDVMMLAKIGLLPTALSRVSTHSGQANNALVCLSFMSMCVLIIPGNITEYALVTVLGIMFGQILLGITALRIPTRRKDEFEKASFRLSLPTLKFFAIGLVIFSLFFIVVSVFTSPKTTAISVIIISLGSIYYVLRRLYLAKNNIDPELNIVSEANVAP